MCYDKISVSVPVRKHCIIDGEKGYHQTFIKFLPMEFQGNFFFLILGFSINRVHNKPMSVWQLLDLKKI